jgi:hypothetical protein
MLCHREIPVKNSVDEFGRQIQEKIIRYNDRMDGQDPDRATSAAIPNEPHSVAF